MIQLGKAEERSNHRKSASLSPWSLIIRCHTFLFLIVVFLVQSTQLNPISSDKYSLLFAESKPSDIVYVSLSVCCCYCALASYGIWTLTNEHKWHCLDIPFICIWIPKIFHYSFFYKYVCTCSVHASCIHRPAGLTLYAQCVCVAAYTVHGCGLCVSSLHHVSHPGLKTHQTFIKVKLSSLSSSQLRV